MIPWTLLLILYRQVKLPLIGPENDIIPSIQVVVWLKLVKETQGEKTFSFNHIVTLFIST